MKHYGDIKSINGPDLAPVDVIIGGSPCQNLSIAGNRQGLSGEQSSLFLEQIRIIKESRKCHEKPRFMLWENVPGALTSNNGEDFRRVLEETVRIKEVSVSIPRPANGKWSNAGCIMGDGFSVAWRIHDAQYWGVPQRRRRIALVADFGGVSAPEVLFERKSVRGDNPASGAAGKAATGAPTSGVIADNRQSVEIEEASRRPVGIYDARGNGDGKTATTITGDHESRITDYTNVICLQGNGIDRADTAGCNGKGWTENVSYTLNTVDRPAVAYAIGNGQSDNTGLHDVAGALNCMHDQQAVLYEAYQHHGYRDSDISGTLTDGSSCVRGDTDLVVEKPPKYIVRRLTPLECERLQGLPDGWTDIGEWTDTKGKTHKTSDTARYKAIGNSIALPFWQWLLNRFAPYLPESPTMGSLFDGIGGFPLCWERIYGKGTAVWASEIEPFCIAVTERRFNAR